MSYFTRVNKSFSSNRNFLLNTTNSALNTQNGQNTFYNKRYNPGSPYSVSRTKARNLALQTTTLNRFSPHRAQNTAQTVPSQLGQLNANQRQIVGRNGLNGVAGVGRGTRNSRQVCQTPIRAQGLNLASAASNAAFSRRRARGNIMEMRDASASRNERAFVGRGAQGLQNQQIFLKNPKEGKSLYRGVRGSKSYGVMPSGQNSHKKQSQAVRITGERSSSRKSGRSRGSAAGVSRGGNVRRIMHREGNSRSRSRGTLKSGLGFAQKSQNFENFENFENSENRNILARENFAVFPSRQHSTLDSVSVSRASGSVHNLSRKRQNQRLRKNPFNRQKQRIGSHVPRLDTNSIKSSQHQSRKRLKGAENAQNRQNEPYTPAIKKHPKIDFLGRSSSESKLKLQSRPNIDAQSDRYTPRRLKLENPQIRQNAEKGQKSNFLEVPASEINFLSNDRANRRKSNTQEKPKSKNRLSEIPVDQLSQQGAESYSTKVVSFPIIATPPGNSLYKNNSSFHDERSRSSQQFTDSSNGGLDAEDAVVITEDIDFARRGMRRQPEEVVIQFGDGEGRGERLRKYDALDAFEKVFKEESFFGQFIDDPTYSGEKDGVDMFKILEMFDEKSGIVFVCDHGAFKFGIKSDGGVLVQRIAGGK